MILLNMRRLITILLSVFSVIPLSAQTQHGYVKTKGRLGHDGKIIPGVSLPGATVSIKDRSTLISASNGTFSFPLPGKNYIVQNVRKKGYLLTDAEQLRSYDYSSNPLILVMETPQQQNEDRLMAERKINRTLRRTIQQREDELDSLREANRITKEEYDKLYAQLYDDEERNRKLINEMVERYAKMDFDQMDERNREIKACILNGELLKADSLINSKGSLDTRIMEYNRLREANAHEAEELKKRSETLASSRTIEEKTLLELAEDCFNKSEVFKMGHQNDSAAYYLTIRAELDTTNVQWLLEAGKFISDYIADYNEAQAICQRALQNAKDQYGDNSRIVAVCYMDIGYVYHSATSYNKAMIPYYNAKSILEKLYGDSHPDIAACYIGIGIANFHLGMTNIAMGCFNKSLEILKSVYGENHILVAECYRNIGDVFYRRGYFLVPIWNYTKALDILKLLYGENHVSVAECYIGLSHIYMKTNNADLIFKYSNDALIILKSIYGKHHPRIAECYKGIAYAYMSNGETDIAIDYYCKALSIFKSVYGEKNESIARIYNDIGKVYTSKGEYKIALEYINKAFEIFDSSSLYVQLDKADGYVNKGNVYMKQNLYSDALACFEKALEIRAGHYGRNIYPFVTECNKKIYTCYISMLKKEISKIVQYREYMMENIFTIQTYDNSSFGQEEYYLLEFADWNQNSLENLFDKNAELQGKPKNIVVMKDGVITKHHFEDKIGCQIGIKYVGKEEKQHIVELYNTWKDRK